jgi:hypothetical protein
MQETCEKRLFFASTAWSGAPRIVYSAKARLALRQHAD